MTPWIQEKECCNVCKSLPVQAHFLFCVFAVPFVEFFDPASGRHITLLTSEERMAFGANVHPQFLFHTASFECIPTATNHGAFTVVRMDTLFHYETPLSEIALIYPDINA
jgi:hypothetical protein